MNRGVRWGEGWASMRDAWDGEDGWLYGNLDYVWDVVAG